jgi:hypothetical protein
MTPVVIPAHFDGERIQLDEPVRLEPNTRLLVQVLPPEEDDDAEWYRFALQRFAAGYSDDETEYSFDDLVEVNPYYAGR